MCGPCEGGQGVCRGHRGHGCPHVWYDGVVASPHVQRSKVCGRLWNVDIDVVFSILFHNFSKQFLIAVIYLFFSRSNILGMVFKFGNLLN